MTKLFVQFKEKRRSMRSYWSFRVRKKTSWLLGLFDPSNTESHFFLKTRNYFSLIMYKILATNVSGHRKKMLPVMASPENL